MIPATTARVPLNTSESINWEIERSMLERVACYRHASPESITRRLWELEEEWDIERILEANAATVCVLGVVLGATVDRRWFYLPGIVGGFLLQHAMQGWCPPLPIFRRLGIRTSHEIEAERTALKLLRGDFAQISEGASRTDIDSLIDSVEK